MPKSIRRAVLAFGNPYCFNDRPSAALDPEPPTPEQTREEIQAALQRQAETGEYPSDEVWERMTAGLRERAQSDMNRSSVPLALNPVVYYFRVGNRIKIGYTGNLAERERALMPEEVLGWEPGSQQLEHLRHEQFAMYRVAREWFEDCPAIREHIALVRKERRAPVSGLRHIPSTTVVRWAEAGILG